MAADQIKRFDRWRRFLRPNSAHLVQLVLDEVVPEFRRHGFERYPDYAGGSAIAVGGNCIPLQRRSGSEWPTVEIRFDGRGRPSLGVNFSMLPDTCRGYRGKGWTDIPRIEANVVEGPIFFTLAKGHRRDFDGNFGYQFFSFRPKLRIRREVDELKSLLPWLFGVLANGIPLAWMTEKAGRVDSHALSQPNRSWPK